MRETETGIVVAGAGAAGLIAALVAAHKGREVTILEKDTQVLSNTQLSAGLITAAGTFLQRQVGIDDTPELLAADIMDYNSHQSDPEVTLAICRKSAEVIDFLAHSTSLDFHVETTVWYPGHKINRQHVLTTKSGIELVRGMREAVNSRPEIAFVDRAPLIDLIVEDNAVVGVIAGTPGHELAIHSRAVILACGGFGGNRDLVSAYIPEMAGAGYIGGAGNSGDGLLLALRIGAAVDYMGSYHPMAFICHRSDTFLSPSVAWLGGILVNLAGSRFTAEDQTNAQVAKSVQEQQDGLAVALYDERIANIVKDSAVTNRAIAAGAVYTSESLQGIAEHFRIDASVLEDTLQRYNAGVAAGTDEFGRHLLTQPLAPPFHAALTTIAIAETQGGLKVDQEARVIRADGTVIPSLYAAGGAAAGISGDRGGGGYLHGNGLLHALGLGMIAGERSAIAI